MNKLTAVFISALLLPLAMNAQWSAVHFDSANIFRVIQAVTPNDVFATGTTPNTGEYFIYRTGDGGATWDSIGINATTDEYQVGEIYFPDATNGFIGGRKNHSDENLLKTTDNGTTWTDVTPDPNSTYAVSGIYFLDPQQGWVTAYRDLYITANAGASWTTVHLDFIPSDIHFTSPLIGYAAGGDTMTSAAVIMKTLDGGLTWSPVLTNYDVNVFVNSDNNFCFVNSTTILASQDWTNKIYRTQDGGATWDSIICDSATQITDFHFTSADSGQVLTSMGQIFYTNDAGATWNLAYATAWGFYGPSVYFFSLSFSQGVGYVCGTSGLIKRYDHNLLSVNEQLQATGSLTAAPNPCYGDPAILIYSNGINGDCSLWIVNALGEVVYFENIPGVNNGVEVSVNRAQFAAGTYTVIFQNDTQKQTTQFIIAD